MPRSWLQASNNLLVIFEETKGNPFEISIKLQFSEIICGQVSESDYAPLDKQSHSNYASGYMSVDDKAPEMNLQCDAEHVITAIEFASYGTPHGSCQKLLKGKCHAPSSVDLVSKVNIFRN